MTGGSAIVMMIKHYLSYYPDSFRRIFVINGKKMNKNMNKTIL
jgi:hypothetical protein